MKFKVQTNPTWKTHPNPTLLQDTIEAATKGITNIYSAGGSGKTHSIKEYLTKHPAETLVISPYKVAKDDYSGVTEYQHYFDNSLPNFEANKSQFTYISNLLTSMFKVADDKGLDILKDMRDVVELTVFNMLNNNDGLKLIIDEADAVELQTKMHSATYLIEGREANITDWSELYNTFIQVMGTYVPVIKISATVCDDSTGSSVVIPMGTTVRTPRIHNYAMPERAVSDNVELLESLIETNIQEGKPTLVFMNKYPDAYYALMQKLAANGVPTMIVTRNDKLSTRIDSVSKVLGMSHEHYQFEKYDRVSGAVSLKQQANVMVVDNEDLVSLDMLFKEFKVIFVTQSHSRVVSIHAAGGFNSASVITIGSVLTSASFQAGWRFRDVDVTVHNILTSKTLTKEVAVATLEGIGGWNTIAKIAPNIDEYGIEEIVLHWLPKKKPSTKGKAIGKAIGKAVGKAKGKAVGISTKGMRVGKAVGKAKGKAVGKAISDATKLKQDSFDTWFKQHYNPGESVRSNHRQYTLANPDGYGLGAFQKKVEVVSGYEIVCAKF